MKKIISITKAVGMTAFIAAVILKSVYFLHIIKENFSVANILLIIGIMLLALSYFVSNIESNVGKIKMAFNLLFSIFLIGSLFFLIIFPGGNAMLFIVISLIPILMLLLLANNNMQQTTTFTREDLLWVIAILFVMLFLIITWNIHLGSILSHKLNLSNLK
jgi:hypothetical protein